MSEVCQAQLSLTNRPTIVHTMLCCQELPSVELLQFIGRIFRLLPTPLPFDALSEGGALELSGAYLVQENKYGRVTMWWRSHDDGLSRLGTIHQRDRHTDSHVAIENAHIDAVADHLCHVKQR